MTDSTIEQILRNAFERGLFPGACWGVYVRGKPAASGEIGFLDTARTRPVSQDTIWDCASLTKPVVTATCALLLKDQRLIRLEKTVGEFYPELAEAPIGRATIHRLLTHVSGLPAWADLYSETTSADEAAARLLQICAGELAAPPGLRYEYSCLGYILIGLILERISGTRLDSLAKQLVFGPLGMRDTAFNPADRPALLARVAHTSDDPSDAGRVHDGNARALSGAAGNAGLFSTVGDLAAYCDALLRGDILSESSRGLAFENQLNPAVGGQTIGWFTAPNEMLPVPEGFPASAIGHTGFTGTSIVIEPESQMAAILLTNRVCGQGAPEDMGKLRRAFHAAALKIV